MKTNDPGAYGQMFRLAEDSPYEFLQKLQDGSCILLPDGTRVEVKQPSPGTRLMWRIRHKGKDWWIIGAFMLDTNCVRMDLKYKDK